MSRDPGPVFLARRTYRRRRLTDAARMLPLLGVVLFCIPLLWRSPEAEPARTTTVMLYVFGVWAGLVALSAVISARLPGHDDPAVRKDRSDAGDG
ncbi:hypothetical protein [Roseovarius salinarum]|uniref:hypothetical protein n=1 Tax=Roseovarius salinarum TaxID=1981892 RepID=UPI000C34714A|nr:hypothetical protein [Roseovarius salinarum]